MIYKPSTKAPVTAILFFHASVSLNIDLKGIKLNLPPFFHPLREMHK